MTFTVVTRAAVFALALARVATSHTPHAQYPTAAASRPLAIAHVTVIDATDSTPRRDQTVIIRGTRIISVEPSRSAHIPANARTLDGRGKFMIPGYWDMRVHTSISAGRELLGLFVANGVTGVRDMADDWSLLTAWRHEIARHSHRTAE
jgi:adenine deaminase